MSTVCAGNASGTRRVSVASTPTPKPPDSATFDNSTSTTPSGYPGPVSVPGLSVVGRSSSRGRLSSNTVPAAYGAAHVYPRYSRPGVENSSAKIAELWTAPVGDARTTSSSKVAPGATIAPLWPATMGETMYAPSALTDAIAMPITPAATQAAHPDLPVPR